MAPTWIWQQPDWPRFRWQEQRLQPLLLQAQAAHAELLAQLRGLETPLAEEAVSALLSRESLGTAAIEGEALDPAQVRSSIARRLGLPLADGQPPASAQVEGLLDVLLAATSSLEEPLELASLHQWHRRLFAAGPDGLRSIRIGELRGEAPMQVLSGPIGRERLHFEAPPRADLEPQLEALLAIERGSGPRLVSHPPPLRRRQWPPGAGDRRSPAGPDLRGRRGRVARRPRPWQFGPDPAGAAGLLRSAGTLPAR